MKSTDGKQKRTGIQTVLLAMIIWICAYAQGVTQVLHTPINTAMGGGGTASTTGYESLFINPANLFIQEKNYGLQISAATAGSFMTAPERIQGVQNYGDRYLSQSTGFNPEDAGQAPVDFNQLIERNYGSDRLLAEHQSAGEIHWLGLQWSRVDKSYALAVRSRFANRSITGRGYYDSFPVNAEGQFNLERSLTHQFQSLHEISFGYAESFTFINALIPQLSQLIVGIAPKVVVGGAYLNSTYTDQYIRQRGESIFRNEESYTHFSTGPFSEMSNLHRSSLSPFEPLTNREDLFRPTGIGAGFDVGLTYLITLGDDFSAVDAAEPETRKSLRLGFSITDIGFINYYERPVNVASGMNRSEVNIPDLPQESEIVFEGQPGEQLYFLGQNGTHPLLAAGPSDSDSFAVLMPTALHGGLLFQLNRIKVTGDMSLGLTDNAFNSTRLITYIGAEIRPLSWLPLRAGTRIAQNLPGYFSIGTGLETRYFDVNGSMQFRRRSLGPTAEIVGISMVSLRLYIP